ncbi:M20 family metallopeptidase [Fretibacter rubidus]|uniref:M20 metallopeptidase family protein n=1 Tax=Fretibacter rubidus TaxID=570162 RepID=UPI00352A9104
MKKLLLCSALAVGFGTSAQAQDLMSVYKHLHANPELSLMEVETARYLAARLKAEGFEVTEQFGGTGVVAVMKNGPGKTVMLRADMDALPVKEETGLSFASTVITRDAEGNDWPAMHACGHDIHMTVALGAARELAAKKDQWSGTLIVILQPAEEISQGALAMLGEGLFEKFPRPDYNLALHANSGLEAGYVGIVPGYALANVDSMDITVQGIGGHGAYPHTTKDPVVLAAQMVLAFQAIIAREISPQEPAVITVGSIHGGTKHNIIGEEVKMQLTLRSYSEDVRQQTIEAIKRTANGLAAAYGLPEDKMPIISLRNEYTPSAYNNPDLAETVMAMMKNQIGDDKVVQLDPVMGGEDFGRYGKVEPKIPSLIYWLGAASSEDVAAARSGKKPLPSLHSPFFKPDAATAIPTGVTTMSETAIALFAK